MKKVAILTLVAALVVALTAGTAVAKPGKGKAKKAKKVPTVAFVFEGTVASVDDVTGSGSVTVKVEEANSFAKSYLASQQDPTQVTINVDATTKIKKDDATATLADIAPGDETVFRDRAPKGTTSFTADMVTVSTPEVM